MELSEIKLTKEQQSIVDFDSEEMLVRGIAGSGKTLVLIRKAKKASERHPEDKIAIFTYAGALTESTKYIVETQRLANIEVLTFHSWAMKNYRKIVGHGFKLVKNHEPQLYLKQAIRKLSSESHRFVDDKSYLEFLSEEIRWIKGKGISSLEEYLEVNRKGRGIETRVTASDRKIIYKIYKQYNNEKKNKLDFDDFGFEILKNIDKLPDDLKIDRIYIDEAQDLQQVQLEVLRCLAKKAFVVAADKGQKIYKTSFTWKEIGLNITGSRTKVLKNTHRSTKQIIKLASSLQRHDTILNDEEYVEPVLPNREGALPCIAGCESSEEQDILIIDYISELIKRYPEKSIGVLYRGGKTKNSPKFRLAKMLKEKNIPFENIRQGGNSHTPGVKLCTFHSSKGLEFDYVFIIDLNEPDKISEEKDVDYWTTERRLLYVSMTRAKSNLYLFYYGTKSRLINELDSSLYAPFSLR